MARSTLDSRIAHALKNGAAADRDTLFELNNAAADEVDALRATIAAEEPKLLDIGSPDPDKTQATIAAAKLRIERLTKVILEELQPRVRALDAAANLAEWNATADRLQAESDKLWVELETAYATVCEQLVDVWKRVDANAAAISAAHRRRPSGVMRHITGADHPQLRANLRLPCWDAPDRIVFPRDEAWAFQANLANMMVAQAKAFDAKMLISPDQQRSEDDKREAEMKARAIAERDAYFKAQLEAERKHMRGER